MKIDRRLFYYECVILLFTEREHEHIVRNEFFQNVVESSVDGSLALIEFERDERIDWKSFNDEDP